MNGLNIKELCKQIKKSKNNMMWTRNDGYHYITNRHWLVRFTEVPREVLVTLFSVFAAIPDEGRALVMSFLDVQEREHVLIDTVYAKLGDSMGQITPFIKDLGDIRMRVITCDESVMYINDEFIKLVGQQAQPMCAGVSQPISFLEGNVILLPYRTSKSEDDETVKHLLAS